MSDWGIGFAVGLAIGVAIGVGAVYRESRLMTDAEKKTQKIVTTLLAIFVVVCLLLFTYLK